MAYLGNKTGAEILAKETRAQADLHRRNAMALDDPDLAGQAAKLLAAADRLDAEAAAVEAQCTINQARAAL